MIDIKDEYLQIIKDNIRRFFPDCIILVYGSRVKGTSWEFSDIDIAIDCKDEISFGRIYDLKEAISLTDIPMMVDICDLNGISEIFRNIILDDYEVLELK